jgi:hypothetical protein
VQGLCPVNSIVNCQSALLCFLPCLQTVAAVEERLTLNEDSGRRTEAALAQLACQQGQNPQQRQQQPAGPTAAFALAPGEVAPPAELTQLAVQ